MLDVPIAGDIANPKFKLGKVVGRAMLKVFFGPLMGSKDKDRTISDEELHEVQELLSEDTLRQDTTALAEPSLESADRDSIPSKSPEE